VRNSSTLEIDVVKLQKLENLENNTFWVVTRMVLLPFLLFPSSNLSKRIT